MKTFLIGCVWTLASIFVAFGETGEKFEFKPLAKNGDVFDYEETAGMSMKWTLNDKPIGKLQADETKSSTETIAKVDSAGVITEMLTATKAHKRKLSVEQVGQAQKRDMDGPLNGVSLRTTLTEKGYKKTLAEGATNQEIEQAIRRVSKFCQDEEALPSIPLAVGETQTIKDDAEIVSRFEGVGQNIKSLDPLAITLKEVKAGADGRIATLESKTTLQFEQSLGGGPSIPVDAAVTILAEYNLDQRFVSKATLTLDAHGSKKNAEGTELFIEYSVNGSLTRKRKS